MLLIFGVEFNFLSFSRVYVILIYNIRFLYVIVNNNVFFLFFILKCYYWLKSFPDQRPSYNIEVSGECSFRTHKRTFTLLYSVLFAVLCTYHVASIYCLYVKWNSIKHDEVMLNNMISTMQEVDNTMRISLEQWEKCRSACRIDDKKVSILNNSDVLEHSRVKRSEGSTADERNGGKKKNRNNRTRSIGII